MKGKVLIIFFIVENLALAGAFLLRLVGADSDGNAVLFRESSPDGAYVLDITEIGTPTFPFGPDRVGVALYDKEAPDQRVTFMADVRNDGARAEFEATWLDDGAQIVLRGDEQPAAYYVLPFKSLSDPR